MDTLWTIGYEGHSPESLVLRLRAAGIQRLIDIRELPLSRKAGFSKRAFAMGMEHAGISYTHLRALGTPRAIRHAYMAGGAHDAFRDGYLDHIAHHEDAVAELEALATNERCAVLCVEADHAKCHRGILGDVLAQRGWRIEHL